MLDLKNRLVSILHGTLGALFGGYWYFVMGESCGSNNTVIEQIVLANTCGYFLYDAVALIYYGLADMAMLFHHTLAVSGFAITMS